MDVGPRFDDLEIIASGTFGEVYTAKDTLEDELCVLKIEDAKDSYDSLSYEAVFLKHLKKKDVVGVPSFICQGETPSNRYIAMKCLGPSLKHLLDFCGGQISATTTLAIGL